MGQEDGRGAGATEPLLGPAASAASTLSDEPVPNSPPLHPARLTSLACQDSVLVTGRIGRLQSSERIMAFTDAVLAIICTSCAVPLWANGTEHFNPVRLVPFVTTFLVLSRLWEKHCQDFSRVTGVDEWLAQVNTWWIAALSLLPFAFVVLFVPTNINGHIVYLALLIAILLLVGFTSWLLSRASRRLTLLREGDREYKGWLGRDLALTIAMVETGAIVVGLSLLAWREGIDILTDDYKEAFKPGHVSAGAVVFLLGLALFWLGLAGRLNFQLLRQWLGAGSAVLFDGRVPRVRVEIFSDGVYAASATGLMIELLSGLLKAEAHGSSGDGEGEGHHGSVWPGLVNYIYCFHIVAVLHRSHQNVVAKIPSFTQGLLAINALVCLSVAFIPTLSTILDGTWGHDAAALTTAAFFLLCASLLLLALLAAALKASPMAMDAPHAEQLLGVHEDPDALLAEMLGRPLGDSGFISGGLMRMGTSFHGGGGDNDEPDRTANGQGGGGGGAYLPPLHAQPRLFNDPSCLPRGGRGAEPDLLRRLQAIRDGYELRSACILPCMALGLTLLTLACQAAGRRESPYLPLAFGVTFFVYSIERHVLRPRAAKQIYAVQRELRKQAHRSSNSVGSSSYAFLPRGGSGGVGGRGGSNGSGGGGVGGWRQLAGPATDLVGGGGEDGRLAPVAEGSGDYSRSESLASSAVMSREGSWTGEMGAEAGAEAGDEEEGGDGVGDPSEPPRHVTFSSSVVGGRT